ncbi:MAG TPA: glycosyltransferase family 4 protein [Candidatus Methylomirabilis sp.]|nr:glycosyltransferase family 4 protein [Candidatus Methylomirabilis sp.]
MQILHVHKFFNQLGGAELYVHRLMQKQVEAGHEVHILSTRSSANLPTPDAKYFIHRYDFSRAEGPRKDAVKATTFLWNREARRATERAIREVRPDVIHLHNIYHHFSTSILGPIHRSGIPCVQTLHDLKLACPNYLMFTEGAVCERCKGGKYWNPILHHCVSSRTLPNVLAGAEMTFAKITQAYEKTVRRFIAPSEFLAKKMVEWGEPAGKFTVLRNPTDASATVAPCGGGYLLFAGRLTAQKGVETLIRASLSVPTLPLRIAGTGPDEERLRHLVRTERAYHITFLGFVPPAELLELRRSADALMFPSVGYENSPLSILEAMGDGVPVLASDIGGVPELVEHGANGLLAPPGNVPAWTDLLRRFQSMNRDERRAMGERGRERARTRHDWAGHLAGLERIYADAARRA